MVCGIDFYYSFYDDWVARDINGKHLNRIYPYFHDKKNFFCHILSPTFTQKRILISAAASVSL